MRAGVWIRCKTLLPPLPTIAAFFLAYLGAEILIRLCLSYGEVKFGIIFILIQWGLIFSGVLLLAGYRVFGKHPVFDPEYTAWLSRSPWHWPNPLPLGPVHVCWMDLLIMIVMDVLFFRYPFAPELMHPVYLFLLFFGVYLGSLLFSFLATRERWGIALLGFGLLLILWAAQVSVWAVCCLMAALYSAGWWRLRAVLRGFPANSASWEGSPFIRMFQRNRRSGKIQQPPDKGMGWPWGALSPEGTKEAVPSWDGFLFSVWAGLALFTLLGFQNAKSLESMLVMVYWMPMTVLSFGRIFIYGLAHRPPMNIAGRIGTFRWVLPSYDRIFAPSLAALAGGYGLPKGLASLGCPPAAGYGIASSVVMGILLLSGPSLRTWNAVGFHRMRPDPNQRPLTRLSR